MDELGSTRAIESDPLVGTEIQGRYRILKRLGAGGMGMVYLGEHLLIRRKVAIKTLHAFYATNRDVVSRFHREALAATSIGNEHIVEVTDMGHLEGGAMYMVLEYLDGSDLGHCLEQQGPQSLGRVVHILLQMCEALVAVHAQGIVHRDLKPDNVFLIKRGDNPDFVKVLDFGISKFKHGFDDREAKMTATGAMLGTPFFMAPEQAQGAIDVDHRADIYALGAIIYYALTGHHPFEAQNLPQLFIKICTEEPPPLRSLRPDLPAEVETIVHRALSKLPGDRYQSAEELRQALLPFATLERVVPSGPALPSTSLPISSPGAVPARTADPVADVSGPIAAGSLGGASTSVVTQPSSARSKKLLAASVALGLTAVAAGGAWFIAGRSTPSATTPAPEALAQASGSVEPLGAVRVTVSTQPRDAELFLDGHRIANPFDADLPKTDQPRVLEARLAGYPPVKQELVLMYPQTVRLELKQAGQRVEPAPAEPVPAAESGRPREKATPRREASAGPAREASVPAIEAAKAPPPAPPLPTEPEAPALKPPAPTSASTSNPRKLKTPF